VDADDPYDLERFVTAQDDARTYDRALDELHRGRKTTHWMWFVFPQLLGLGQSSTARHFGIGSLPEAQAYLRHPVLGPRLYACTDAVLEHTDLRADAIFGSVDALKLRSSMTLFLRAAPGEPAFGQVLEALFDGERDGATDRLLSGQTAE
jgi:uncharacterized protein (DUF1810 family)